MQFSCDYCSASISLKDKSCPQCGSVFAFVRCSNCQYNGESSEFKKGCPECGAKKNIIAKKTGEPNVKYKKMHTRNKGLWFWILVAFIVVIDVVLFLYAAYYI